MANEFDQWVIVEGHAKPGGSTSWCNDLRIPVRSTDGSHEFLLDFSMTHNNVTYYSNGGYWESKDEQANKALEIIGKDCLLWQVDVDEVWTSDDLAANERILKRARRNCGRVQFNHIVGKHENALLVARGRWGSTWVNRLWDWQGEKFESHEPAIMKNQKIQALPRKFDHYSLFFEEDVKFKSKYYKGYERLYENWKKMLKKGKYPCRVSELLDGKDARGSRIFKQLRR